jgi:hypothetical protein
MGTNLVPGDPSRTCNLGVINLNAFVPSGGAVLAVLPDWHRATSEIQPNQGKSDQIKVNQTKSDRIKPNQGKPHLR